MKSRFIKAAVSLTLVLSMLSVVPYVNAITVGETAEAFELLAGQNSTGVANQPAAEITEEVELEVPETFINFTEDASITGKVEADYQIDENGIAWPSTTGAHVIELFETPGGKVPYTYELSGYTPDAVAATPNALGVVFAKDKGGVYVYSLSAYNTSQTLTTTLRNVFYVPYNTDGSFKTQTGNIAYLSETYDGGTSGSGSVGNTIIQAYEVLDKSYTGEVNELAQSKGYISTKINASSSTGKMSSFRIDETDSNVQVKQGYTIDKYSYKYYLKASGDAVYIYADMIFENPDDPSMNHTWRTLTDCFSLENFEARKNDWKTLYGSAKALDTAYYNAGDHSDFEITFGVAVSPKAPKSGFKSVVTDVNAVYVSPYIPKNGIITEAGGMKLYYRNFFLTGLQLYNNDYYFCDEDTGYIRTSGTYEVDGVKYEIQPDGKFKLDTSMLDPAKLSFYNEHSVTAQNKDTFLAMGDTIGADKDFEAYLLNAKGEKAVETDKVTKALLVEGKTTFIQPLAKDAHIASATYTLKGSSETGSLGVIIARDENGYFTYKITPAESISSNIFFNRSIEYHKFTDSTKTTVGTDAASKFDIASILGSSDLLYANATRVGAKRSGDGNEIYSTVKGGIFESGTTKALSTNYPVSEFSVQYFMTVDTDSTITIYAVLTNGESKWTTYAEEFSTDSFAFATDDSWLKYSTVASTAYRKYTAMSHNDITPIFGAYKGIAFDTKGKLTAVQVEIESLDYTYTQLEAGRHIWKTTVIAPTCCESGYIHQVCDCGAEQTLLDAPAYGHTYDAENLTVVQEADSTTNSIKNGYCTECGIHCYYIEQDYEGNIISELVLNGKNEWVTVE